MLSILFLIHRLMPGMGNRLRYLLLFYIAAQFFACRKISGSHDKTQSNISIFEEDWQAIDKHYTLFGVKNINWDSVGSVYRLMVKNEMSSKELFLLLSKMNETLKDGHVALISQEDTATYTSFYTTFPLNFNYHNILTTYLKNEFMTAGPVIYKIQNNIGYLYYDSFEHAITAEQLDIVMAAMKNTRGLIIDVRSNHGGDSRNAEMLFSHFITTRSLVKYEIFKNGPGRNDFATPEPYYINPSTSYYPGAVCLLINRGCYSTCNDAALYFSMLSNCTLIGDQTGGGGGIPNNYLLANGWKLQYTASATISADKKNIENGIQPSVHVSITSQDESNGKDPILEKAIQLLQ